MKDVESMEEALKILTNKFILMDEVQEAQRKFMESQFDSLIDLLEEKGVITKTELYEKTKPERLKAIEEIEKLQKKHNEQK